jgi:hypothetical protein
MQKLLVFIPAFGLLFACNAAPEQGTLAWRSTLHAQTRGIGLHRDGTTGHAGMWGTNCPFETVNGTVTGDADLPDEDEEVQDVGESHLGDDSVILVIDDTLFLLDKGTGVYEQDDFPVEDLREGRFGADGIVTLRGEGEGCAIDWYADHTLTSTTHLDSCPADVAFDVDPTTGTAALVSERSVQLVTAAGATTTTVTGDLVAWDRENDLVYVAEMGATRISAIRPDGSTAWAVDVAGDIAAIDAAGTPGGAALSVATADGRGELMLLDAANGSVVATVGTPAAATGVEASPDGSTIALIRPDAAHFYVLAR